MSIAEKIYTAERLEAIILNAIDTVEGKMSFGKIAKAAGMKVNMVWTRTAYNPTLLKAIFARSKKASAPADAFKHGPDAATGQKKTAAPLTLVK